MEESTERIWLHEIVIQQELLSVRSREGTLSETPSQTKERIKGGGHRKRLSLLKSLTAPALMPDIKTSSQEPDLKSIRSFDHISLVILAVGQSNERKVTVRLCRVTNFLRSIEP